MQDKKQIHPLSHQHLLDILNQNSDWFWEVDQTGCYTYASDMVQPLLGYTPEFVLGKTPFDLMPSDEAERVAKIFTEIVEKKTAFSGLINRNLHADGHVVILETSGIPLFNEQGELSGYRGIDRDISQLGQRVLQLESIYDNTPVALGSIDRQGQMIMANQALMQLLNVSKDMLSDLNIRDLVPQGWEQVLQEFALADLGLPLTNFDFYWNGRTYYTMPFPIMNAQGIVIGLSAACVDITERIEIENQLAQANQRLKTYAQQDYLTGLYNRRYIDTALVQQLKLSLYQHHVVSICLIDIDFFKLYNDTHGHLEGDCCLKQVAHALAEYLTPTYQLISRWGGEEFLLVFPNMPEPQVSEMAEQLREHIEQLDIAHPSSPLGKITISVGTATSTFNQLFQYRENLQRCAQELIGQADIALYQAKQHGRNCIVTAQSS